MKLGNQTKCLIIISYVKRDICDKGLNKNNWTDEMDFYVTAPRRMRKKLC